MTKFKKLNLQLFAEGTGDGAGNGGAEGAATGEQTAAAGQDQRLRELGVPEAVLKKRANRKGAKPVNAAPAQTSPSTEQVASAENEPTTEETVPEPQGRLTWEQIMEDPEYNAQMQEIVKQRVKDGAVNRSILETLAPALKTLAQEHGLDPENMDYVALAKSITGEYEDKALEMGVSKETAMKLDQQQRTLEQQKIQNHFKKLEQEAEDMKTTFPDFNLRTELQNPAFARMVHPNVGVSVEDAYYAVHRKEIQASSMQVAAQRAALKIANAVQSGSRRPQENGTTAKAPSEVTFDWHNATPEQRAEMKKQIRQAAAQGRKVYPGGM